MKPIARRTFLSIILPDLSIILLERFPFIILARLRPAYTFVNALVYFVVRFTFRCTERGRKPDRQGGRLIFAVAFDGS
jgi:hypothetical protein